MSLRISQKLFLLSGTAIGGFAVLTLIAGVTNQSVTKLSEQLVREDIPQLTAMREATEGLLEMRRYEKDILLNIGNSDAQKQYKEKFSSTLFSLASRLGTSASLKIPYHSRNL